MTHSTRITKRTDKSGNVTYLGRCSCGSHGNWVRSADEAREDNRTHLRRMRERSNGSNWAGLHSRGNS